ncbi:hypothetical protein [uncultured Bifidobacterium sp.]|uniref:hypothetical protein n=1 Tax=uncultured Bifidobacterium sp. TaxID=165187 RepID=UPI002589AF73|nr:hypothetical protein [uncultured Bifidobacterium sp.]
MFDITGLRGLCKPVMRVSCCRRPQFGKEETRRERREEYRRVRGEEEKGLNYQVCAWSTDSVDVIDHTGRTIEHARVSL